MHKTRLLNWDLANFVASFHRFEHHLLQQIISLAFYHNLFSLLTPNNAIFEQFFDEKLMVFRFSSKKIEIIPSIPRKTTLTSAKEADSRDATSLTSFFISSIPYSFKYHPQSKGFHLFDVSRSPSREGEGIEKRQVYQDHVRLLLL